MKVFKGITAALLGTTLLAGAVYAQQTPSAPTQAAAPTAAQQKEAARDFAKLSADGAIAFRALHLARVAIFDADPAAAKKLVADARAALAKAKTDSTAFQKAEADLKMPQGMKGAPVAGSASTQPVAWLPIDGQLTLDEDFVATSAKAAAVAEANKSLEKGQRAEAIEKLRVADVKVMFAMALAPLDKTMADVDQSAKLLDEGKYYEANAALKKVEEGVRYDAILATAQPAKAEAPKQK
ncbi:YfdX family protein [Reyranella sp.]|uniref:YfdX family protein n=1 Tax=Reyranella sp. TaxID=1929291 RepID=UPI00121D25EE|nr:YfdX family protein [Reyranella sp.]TAJ86574.1 MAG: YfdX family protein [Reyranella sp.]